MSMPRSRDSCAHPPALPASPSQWREPSVHSLIARYGLQAKLELIPWEQLPTQLQHACDKFLAAWWDNLGPDEPIKPMGLLDMTVAQLLALWHSQREAGLPLPDRPGLFHRRFRLVSYLRVEPEESVPISFEDALAEQEQQQLLAPECIHRIEEVCQVIVANDCVQETLG